MRYRKLTNAERKARRGKIYSSFENKEVWWYIGNSTTEIFAHVADGTVVRIAIGTRYIRNALQRMDDELLERLYEKNDKEFKRKNGL